MKRLVSALLSAVLLAAFAFPVTVSAEEPIGIDPLGQWAWAQGTVLLNNGLFSVSAGIAVNGTGVFVETFAPVHMNRMAGISFSEWRTQIGTMQGGTVPAVWTNYTAIDRHEGQRPFRPNGAIALNRASGTGGLRATSSNGLTSQWTAPLGV